MKQKHTMENVHKPLHSLIPFFVASQPIKVVRVHIPWNNYFILNFLWFSCYWKVLKSCILVSDIYQNVFPLHLYCHYVKQTCLGSIVLFFSLSGSWYLKFYNNDEDHSDELTFSFLRVHIFLLDKKGWQVLQKKKHPKQAHILK